MSETKRTRKPTKVKCKIKRPYRYADGFPMRYKGEHTLSKEEYEFASMNGCIEHE